jgi:hypothetical protein
VFAFAVRSFRASTVRSGITCSPEPFDDLYVHPLEVSGYYTILFSPSFVLRGMPFHAFILYMIYMGSCGVLDHSGLNVRVPFGLYNAHDHALHHSKFECNYGFPHPFMDLIHGTFTGQFWGKTYNNLLRAPQLQAAAVAPTPPPPPAITTTLKKEAATTNAALSNRTKRTTGPAW